mmetsp:Transcript_17424/g.21285  ORF Transcript_17424/g.21285 Transcript_17424/m.21285 type:complete len:238 (+) Transcript_17424:96-809(+)
MKIILALTIMGCNAFVPQHFGDITRTAPLHAETLEGWKIKGQVKPINNFILIEKLEEQGESEGGILLSKSAKIKKTQGKVISVGPGKAHPDSGKLFPMPVETGDNVIYGAYDGTEVQIDGVAFSLIRDDDILVKFKGGEVTVDSVETVNDGILVFVETKEEETSSGLILSAGDDKKRPSTGVVIKVGPGRMAASGDLLPMRVSVGDQVKFRDYAGNEVKIGDKDYSVVKMPDVIAKF